MLSYCQQTHLWVCYLSTFQRKRALQITCLILTTLGTCVKCARKGKAYFNKCDTGKGLKSNNISKLDSKKLLSQIRFTYYAIWFLHLYLCCICQIPLNLSVTLYACAQGTYADLYLIKQITHLKSGKKTWKWSIAKITAIYTQCLVTWLTLDKLKYHIAHKPV